MKTCRFLSMVSSLWIERPEQMPAVLSRHLARCDSCRRSFQAERDIARRLPISMMAARPTLPPFLKQRILARVHGEEPPSSWSAQATLRWIASAAAITACAALLVLLMPRVGPEIATAPIIPSPNEGATSAELTWPTANALDLGARMDLVRWGEAVQEPLELEWARTVRDGHRLLASVVQSCVPDPAADALLHRTQQILPAPSGRHRLD